MVKKWKEFILESENLSGKRIELVKMEDPYTNLIPGDKGTIQDTDDIGNILVKWDNGSTLSIIPDVDEFDIIEESNINSYKFTTVDFTGGGDGVYALYINDKLYRYGDYYHDKIEIWIKSFIEGAIWAGLSIKHEEIICKDSDLNRDISENGNFPPENLEDALFIDL